MAGLTVQDILNAIYETTGKGIRVVIGDNDGLTTVADIAAPNTDGVSLETQSMAVYAMLRGLAPDNLLDRGKLLGNTAGSGLGVLATAPWIPGASDIKVITAAIGATSASRNTALTPTSGKKVRILSIEVASHGLSTDPSGVQIYFATGAAYLTTPAKAISQGAPGTTGSFFRSWPDGAGPVGAVNDVVSWITLTETETAMELTITYREE